MKRLVAVALLLVVATGCQLTMGKGKNFTGISAQLGQVQNGDIKGAAISPVGGLTLGGLFEGVKGIAQAFFGSAPVTVENNIKLPEVSSKGWDDGLSD